MRTAAAAALFAPAVLLGCNAGRGGGAPAASALALTAEPPGFDFGRVLPDRSLRKEFRLRNAGPDPLSIDSVATDCGCMVAGEYARSLPPGGSTALTVVLETPAQAGALQRTVVVRTPAGSLRLPIRATVVAPGP